MKSQPRWQLCKADYPLDAALIKIAQNLTYLLTNLEGNGWKVKYEEIFLGNKKMRECHDIYEEAVSHTGLCARGLIKFPFFFTMCLVFVSTVPKLGQTKIC